MWPRHIVAVGGLVEDGNGNVLLVRTHYRGWEFPGGQVENGETLEQALVREIKEESGIEPTVRALAGVYSNTGVNVRSDGTVVPTKVMFDFLCDYVSGAPTTSDETSEVLWVPKEDMFKYITKQPYVMRANTLLDYSGQVVYSAYTTQPDFQEHTRRLV